VATTDLKGAQTRISTAPLSPAASAALHRLERAFLPLSLVRAVRRFEAASARRDELAAKRASQMSAAEFDSFKAAHDAVVESVLTLGAAGRLDLIAPAVAASDYRSAEARANELIRAAQSAPMSDLHADDLAHYVDLMAGYRATLADAGRLDLVGGA
jgi:hypothetical protein